MTFDEHACNVLLEMPCKCEVSDTFAKQDSLSKAYRSKKAYIRPVFNPSILPVWIGLMSFSYTTPSPSLSPSLYCQTPSVLSASAARWGAFIIIVGPQKGAVIIIVPARSDHLPPEAVRVGLHMGGVLFGGELVQWGALVCYCKGYRFHSRLLSD